MYLDTIFMRFSKAVRRPFALPIGRGRWYDVAMNPTQAKSADLAEAALSRLEDGAEWLYGLAERLRAAPELGFFERATGDIVAAELGACGARIRRGLALTGLRAEAGPPGAPCVALLADMDALPTQGAPGGVAHSCGHHAQLAVMLGAFRALVEAGVPERAGVRIAFIAAPAEEYVDLERRLALREKGDLRYLSGKQELIRLGVFDDVAAVLKYHSMADSPERKATVNGTLNGFMAKRAEFIGKAAHAGAQPEKGVNALDAASLALQAINAQRSTFADHDHIRVHPILSQGGTVINSVPARAVLETYIRGASHAAVSNAAAKVDRAFCAGALAMGASVVIRSTPGYQALRPSAALGVLLGAAVREVLADRDIDYADASFASDDIGDVASLVPTCQLGYGGFSGTIHAADFAPNDLRRAYLEPAGILARLVCALAEGGGVEAMRIKEEFVPVFSKEDYLASLDAMFGEKRFDAESLGLAGSLGLTVS